MFRVHVSAGAAFFVRVHQVETANAELPRQTHLMIVKAHSVLAFASDVMQTRQISSRRFSGCRSILLFMQIANVAFSSKLTSLNVGHCADLRDVHLLTAFLFLRWRCLATWLHFQVLRKEQHFIWIDVMGSHLDTLDCLQVEKQITVILFGIWSLGSYLQFFLLILLTLELFTQRFTIFWRCSTAFYPARYWLRTPLRRNQYSQIKSILDWPPFCVEIENYEFMRRKQFKKLFAFGIPSAVHFLHSI